MGNAGFQRLALDVIKDALHQWKKSGAKEAKEFLLFMMGLGKKLSKARLSV